MYMPNINIKNLIMLIVLLGHEFTLACIEDGRNCQYSYECCSGACSAAFGFCLHR
ncbi:conotoxin-like protein [Adoxophyes honmai entomopoxvirus 'L']|uniref:Conotoxin-like protein n=1 Tax=Adoxophyes honmai entomopoxvirus 'L' TaxID=1293540 RepID=A0A916KP44_9POXV|nr:conotoxin-like protein [Adoxophyes honmai entomopoxvirus 'L']CCU55449.1 conotoxin-like protein [Adoxophyes honmai entomopoxvirus 'L']